LGSKGSGAKSTSLHICGTGAATKFIFCAQMYYGWLLPADQKLCRNAVGVAEYNSLEIFTALTLRGHVLASP